MSEPEPVTYSPAVLIVELQTALRSLGYPVREFPGKSADRAASDLLVSLGIGADLQATGPTITGTFLTEQGASA